MKQKRPPRKVFVEQQVLLLAARNSLATAADLLETTAQLARAGALDEANLLNLDTACAAIRAHVAVLTRAEAVLAQAAQ